MKNQCTNCGGQEPDSKALSFKKYQDQIRGKFDLIALDNYWNNHQREKLILKTDKEFYNNNFSKYALYLKYLLSPEWKQLGLTIFKRDNGKCVHCGNLADDVHHKTYDNLYKEKLEDLESVCRKCHIEIHTAVLN